jgi:hypothetical protein
MHKKYVELFKELSHATEVAAEQVMEYDKGKNDEKGYATAETLRNDFSALYDKIKDPAFDGKLSKADYARLLVGTYIIVGNLQDRISALQKAIAGYQTDIVPKLSKVVDATDDDAAQALAEEIFVIDEKTEA